MPRFDRYGEEVWHLEYCRVLYNLEGINSEDKKWVDKIFAKSTLKLSEEERLRLLYRRFIEKEEA